MKKKTYSGPTPEESLVQDICALIRQGTAPWRRPWNPAAGAHRNALTGQPYSGTNPALLELGALLHGHTHKLWLGAGQAKANGWWPRKGSRAARILRPQLNTREEETPDGESETRQWMSYKPVAIFSVEDLDAKDEAAAAKLQALVEAQQSAPQTTIPTSAAHDALAAWPVPVTWDRPGAAYWPALDIITMPGLQSFVDRPSGLATWAHEIIHSTGHEARLKRGFGPKNSEAYAREELIAELGSILIGQRLQIGSDINNHASYLDSWLEILQKDTKELFRALSAAKKAVDLVLGPEHPESTANDAASESANNQSIDHESQTALSERELSGVG